MQLQAAQEFLGCPDGLFFSASALLKDMLSMIFFFTHGLRRIFFFMGGLRRMDPWKASLILNEIGMFFQFIVLSFTDFP